MRDFAFIQTAPGQLFVGWGPFVNAPMRRQERPAFFITDFFLKDPHPWRHPESWEEMSFGDFAALFESAGAPQVQWTAFDTREFERLFASAYESMSRGDFKKIVPVIFEHGRLISKAAPWGYFLSRLSDIPAGMSVYGFSWQNHNFIGATPEMLFRSAPAGYETMALAGTRPAERAAELLTDPKELREHRLVVEDIVQRLAPFGNVEVGPLDILRLPTIAHLLTPIRFQEKKGEQMPFVDMVRRLHPTAALGVSPRTEAGERWLREADENVRRRTFGAPFGAEWPDHSGLAVVAIRNIYWHFDKVRVGSGAGLLMESVVDRELEELRQKRDQAKMLFGLAAVSSQVSALSSKL
jgi:menaquinone-specific isochorismate synthase